MVKKKIEKKTEAPKKLFEELVEQENVDSYTELHKKYTALKSSVARTRVGFQNQVMESKYLRAQNKYLKRQLEFVKTHIDKVISATKNIR